jgi:hypothetical protein
VSGGVVKSGLDIREVPPVALENQSMVPDPVAWSVAAFPEQTVVPEAVGAAGGGVTNPVTATGALTHPEGLVSTT